MISSAEGVDLVGAAAAGAAVVTALAAWASARKTARFVAGLSPDQIQAISDRTARAGPAAAIQLAALADRAAIASALRLRRRPARRRPGRPAAGLLAAAGWLLPAASRMRYAEELAAELHELAASGAGPGRQARYALRQLLAAPRMSLALRQPRRRRRAAP